MQLMFHYVPFYITNYDFVNVFSSISVKLKIPKKTHHACAVSGLGNPQCILDIRKPSPTSRADGGFLFLRMSGRVTKFLASCW